MSNPFDIGFALLWLGVVLLLVVLLRRVRQGAWDADAFDAPPPKPKWLRATAYAGTGIAAAGAIFTLWGVL